MSRSVPMSVHIGTGQDAIDAMNMTTLLEIVLPIYGGRAHGKFTTANSRSTDRGFRLF